MFQGKLKTLLTAGIFSLAMGNLNATPLKILVVNNCGAYVHSTAIDWVSNYLVTTLGPQQGWTVVSPPRTTAGLTTLRTYFNTDSLNTFQVVMWNDNTSSGNVITDANQRLAYQTWVRKGGGTLGWHGFLDHADLWPFVTDSILAGTKFTDHSTWNSTGGRNAKVRWDTVKVNGESTVRANNAEYAPIKAGFTYALQKQNSTNDQITYPDEWYSFRSNPRLATPSPIWGNYPRAPDILYTIDENTYDVPAAVKMGPDHPEAWAYKFPPLCDTCRQGRFIFSARGHDVGAYDGKSANAAPNGSDSSVLGPTKTFLLQAIIWAANTGAPTSIKTSGAGFSGFLNTRIENGALKVSVTSAGKNVVELYDLSGHVLGHKTGFGNQDYSFNNLTHGGLYLVKVKAGKQSYTKRVML